MSITDARMARIEEALLHLHRKVDDLKDDLRTSVQPLAEKAERHQVSIAVLKRDRRWIYGILAFLGSALGIGFKWVLHSQ